MKELLKVVGVVAILAAVLFLIYHNDKACSDKGGVYLSREGKCVTGIKEIK